MTPRERTLVNHLQGGFPICERPFLVAGQRLGMSEEEVIEGLRALLEQGVLTRFGPLYHAERMGGSLTLAAMRIPESEFERVAEQVNAFPEVAHNYARDHRWNMWFVLATERPEQQQDVIRRIESATGFAVYNLPKLAEYFVGLHFSV